MEQKVAAEERRGVNAQVFCCHDGQKTRRDRGWLDTRSEVADFHFKAIEIYHEAAMVDGRSDRSGHHHHHEERRVVFMLWWCGCS